MNEHRFPYRKNVAVVVLNSEGLLLACRRSDVDDAWQLPQGGIDDGESPRETLFRELQEEIGTAQVEVIEELPEPICYEWPENIQLEKHFRGQEQVYFLVRMSEQATIDLLAHDPPEFDAYEWLGTEEFLTRVKGFKIEAYRKALALFQSIHPGMIVS